MFKKTADLVKVGTPKKRIIFGEEQVSTFVYFLYFSNLIVHWIASVWWVKGSRNKRQCQIYFPVNTHCTRKKCLMVEYQIQSAQVCYWEVGPGEWGGVRMVDFPWSDNFIYKDI